MNRIERLPPNVVNKIAAGEVIERPASVVKELIENALDAGARRIDVAVERAGRDLLRVVDDGCGIAADQLPLAVASHATSKIRDADDLFHVGTLGFRGEALASIAAVSRITIRSRTPDAEAAAQLEVSAGRLSEVTPCGAPVGTSIEVRDLFFSTPVRAKFLRSTQTEMAHITEAVTRAALAHPARHFALVHNGRRVYDLPPAKPWGERIAQCYGRDLADQLIYVESRDEDVVVSGYVAHPSQSRANQKMQFLFLNGRTIRDRALQHAMQEAYRGLLTTGRYPICFLTIAMPPAAVDVNVHPTKIEVRFQDGGRLYSQILGTLRTKFLTSDLDTALVPPQTTPPFRSFDDGGLKLRRDVSDWARRQADPSPHAAATSPAGEQPPWPDQMRLDLDELRRPGTPLEITDLGRSWSPFDESSRGKQQSVEDAPSAAPESPQPPLDGTTAELGRPAESEPTSDRVSALQVHNRYLITETPDGMVVIDQHALHERILYEQLREKAAAGTLESQRLLVPEPVDLSRDEAAAVIDQQSLLSRLGIDVQHFGGNTVLVSSYPAMLRRAAPAEMLRMLVEVLAAEGRAPEARDVLDELLHSLACKAAIKAGDRLTSEEMGSLLRQRHLVQDTHHCPHGRPTALVLTRAELDRQFQRR